MGRPIDADALKELFSEVIGSIAIKPEMNGNLEHMIRASAMVIQMIDDAPTVQLGTNLVEVGTDLVSRQATYLALVGKGQASKRYKIGETWELNGEEIREVFDALPSAQPELDIWNDGTLHISVSKGQLDKIGRVLVEENGTIFCKLFYRDAEPERKTGHWVYRPEWSKYGDVWSCSECGEKTSQSVMGKPRYKYRPMCGAKMERGEQE